MEKIIWQRRVTLSGQEHRILGSISGRDGLFLGKVSLSLKKGVFLNVRVFDTLLGNEEEILDWLGKLKVRYNQQLIEEIL